MRLPCLYALLLFFVGLAPGICSTFEDSFDRDVFAPGPGWKEQKGELSIVASSQVFNVSEGEVLALLAAPKAGESEDWTVSAETRVRVTAPRWIGVVFGAKEDGSHYVFRVKNGTYGYQVLKVANGEQRVLLDGNSHPKAIATGAFLRLTAERQGANLLVRCERLPEFGMAPEEVLFEKIIPWEADYGGLEGSFGLAGAPGAEDELRWSLFRVNTASN